MRLPFSLKQFRNTSALYLYPSLSVEHSLPRSFMTQFSDITGYQKPFRLQKSAAFTTDLWTEFVKSIGTNLNLVTTFQSKSTTQTEYVDHIITYLHRFLTLFHKTWDPKLSIAEFAINTYVSPTTGQSPYSQLYNQPLHIPSALLVPPTGTDLPRDVHTYVSRWQTDLTSARATLAIGAPWHQP